MLDCTSAVFDSFLLLGRGKSFRSSGCLACSFYFACVFLCAKNTNKTMVWWTYKFSFGAIAQYHTTQHYCRAVLHFTIHYCVMCIRFKWQWSVVGRCCSVLLGTYACLWVCAIYCIVFSTAVWFIECGTLAMHWFLLALIVCPFTVWHWLFIARKTITWTEYILQYIQSNAFTQFRVSFLCDNITPW